MAEAGGLSWVAAALAVCVVLGMVVDVVETEKAAGDVATDPKRASSTWDTSSFLKTWGDWAHVKPSSYAPQEQKKHSGSWSGWASDKLSYFARGASKDDGEAEGKEAAMAEGQEQAGETLKEAKGAAKEGGEKAKEYARKAREGLKEQGGKSYEAGKEYASQATHKLQQEAEL